MPASATLGTRGLPPALRESVEAAEMIVLDLARQVVEGDAPLEALEDARDAFRQILEVARAYLRDEFERDLFAFPRTTRSAAPAAH